MAVNWTKEQQQVIDLRHRNILVSAAAGSGKTAVLVERILTMITDPKNPIDIDRLLIVTFTRAAAAEMRERIRTAVERRLEEDPDNEHLQRQSTLIYNAQINTIDGFCAYVIRNYFHMIDLDPGYRTADEGELRLIKTDVVREVLEDAFAEGEEDFENFIESYAVGKNDQRIEDEILKLYDCSMSYPWPEEWLNNCKEFYHVEDMEDLRKTPWMKALIRETDRNLSDARELTMDNMRICNMEDGPRFYGEAIEQDLAVIEKVIKEEDFNARVDILRNLKMARLSGKKDPEVSEAAREQVKDIRAQVKDILKNLKETYYTNYLEQVLMMVKHCGRPVGVLVDLTLSFARAFAQKKREKNLLDFSDMEHFALDILTKREEGELYSQAAGDLAQRFEEIFIDEYQDSNLVQETILTAVSRIPQGEYNVFMVGDVKQSIYRFRMARPELFMEKFHNYSISDSRTQRIDLHKNFRSRQEVLWGVNYIFKQIMGEDLGGVEYDHKASLYPGAVFPKGSRREFASTEIILVDKDGAGLEEEGNAAAREAEAMAVAQHIRQIVGRELVLDKDMGGYRPARYGDIAILLRTMTGWSDTFQEILLGQGIPSYCASKTGYFSALEVVTVLNYLHILDNPRQDIPYGAILRSPIGGLTAEELAKVRLVKGKGDYYSCVQTYIQEGREKSLVRKLESFHQQYIELRSLVSYTAIHQLIQVILDKTGYGTYAAAMPAGQQRQANLRMLVEKAVEYEKTSYRGLFNFIRYIEHLQKYNVDFGEVNISTGDDLVQIMSIHKSKGLEFPIVFVSGMAKQFNQQDINASLVIHQDMGIGADCIFPEKRIKTTTLMKQVIRHESKLESLGEELRVLYVAMTRAKEKLILTGAVSKLEKLALNCQRFTRRRQTKLPYGILEKARCYFDWVLPALARHSAFDDLYGLCKVSGNNLHPLYLEEVPIEIQVVTPMTLMGEEVERQVNTHLTREIFENWDNSVIYDEKLRDMFRQRFFYQYPYRDQADIPVKVTVSELKKQGHNNEDTFEMYFEPDVVPLIPKFMEEKEEAYEGARRGTAYHRFMECVDLTRIDSIEELDKQMKLFIETGKIDEKMGEAIDLSDVIAFGKSRLGKQMAVAQMTGTLHKEQPFVISQKASDMQERWDDESTILVQGIIDIYLEEEDGIILADYKTDKVQESEELVERYQVQLDYYAQALERLTGKKVKEKVIYSFTLGEEVRI